MTGIYTAPDGTRYSVIRTFKQKRMYYEIAKMLGIGYNLLFIEIDAKVLTKKIKDEKLKLE